MNEITIHGNLTDNPVLNTNPTTGRSATTFDLALNSRYYDRGTGQWRDRTAVYHRVVCFGDLAANTAATLRKGMTVTVTGALADDSYTPNGADKPVRRTRLEAADVAVSLRWATATITRQPTTGQQRPQPATPDASTGPAADTDTPAEATTPAKPRRTRPRQPRTTRTSP
jgi:single-strand DNA-binding protein